MHVVNSRELIVYTISIVQETNRTLGEHIAKAKKGDRSSFRVIFDLLNSRLYAYAVSHTSDREEAYDLVQETFIDLWKQLPRFHYRSDEEFLGFVFLVLKRKIVRRYKKRQTQTVSLDAYIEQVGETVEMSESPEYQDHRVLLKHLDRLSAAAKEVLVLRYWSELSFKEIAEVLKINESAAKVRHHRALEVLRTYCEQYEHP